MGKDPAVLFYTSDFLTGVELMTYEQIGKYIKLLCLQREHGHLALEDMLKVTGFRDKKIFKKFLIDEEGLYYNERMEKEIQKRDAYTQSRSENGKKGGRPSSALSQENHMDNHMGNRNVNKNRVINGNKNILNKNKADKPRYGDFDVNEAFEKAIERSYGDITSDEEEPPLERRKNERRRN